MKDIFEEVSEQLEAKHKKMLFECEVLNLILHYVRIIEIKNTGLCSEDHMMEFNNMNKEFLKKWGPK